jgi:hypothetical protein
MFDIFWILAETISSSLYPREINISHNESMSRIGTQIGNTSVWLQMVGSIINVSAHPCRMIETLNDIALFSWLGKWDIANPNVDPDEICSCFIKAVEVQLSSDR